MVNEWVSQNVLQLCLTEQNSLKKYINNFSIFVVCSKDIYREARMIVFGMSFYCSLLTSKWHPYRAQMNNYNVIWDILFLTYFFLFFKKYIYLSLGWWMTCPTISNRNQLFIQIRPVSKRWQLVRNVFSNVIITNCFWHCTVCSLLHYCILSSSVSKRQTEIWKNL